MMYNDGKKPRVYDMLLIGKKIKMAREKKGYTQEELSGMINISVPYLSSIERGRTGDVGLNIIGNLVKIFEISLDDLVSSSTEEDYSNDLSSVMMNEEVVPYIDDISPSYVSGITSNSYTQLLDELEGLNDSDYEFITSIVLKYKTALQSRGLKLKL